MNEGCSGFYVMRPSFSTRNLMKNANVLSGRPSPLFTVFHKLTSAGGGAGPFPLALGSENALTNACALRLITGFGHKFDESRVETMSKNGPACENLRSSVNPGSKI